MIDVEAQELGEQIANLVLDARQGIGVDGSIVTDIIHLVHLDELHLAISFMRGFQDTLKKGIEKNGH